MDWIYFSICHFKNLRFRRKALALKQALHHPLAALVRDTKSTEFGKIDKEIIFQRIAKNDKSLGGPLCGFLSDPFYRFVHSLGILGDSVVK